MTNARRVPLYGRRIVVTRPRIRASEWVRRFAGAGADVILFPTFELVLPDAAECAQIFETLRDGAERSDPWLAVTSPTSAENVLNIVERQARGFDWLERYRLAAVGDATRKILVDRGLEVSVTSERSNARELAKAMIEAGIDRDSHVLHVSSSKGRPELLALLEAHGATGSPLHVAHQRPIDDLGTQVLERELAGAGIDLLTFASPSAARQLFQIAPSSLADELRAVAALAVGPTTRDALTQIGFRTITTSPEPGVDSVLETVSEFFSQI